MKKLVIALMLVFTAGATMAQNEAKQRWSHFETNRFIDNWELSVGAGVQTMYVLPGTTEDDVKLNPNGFGKDLTFALDANLTKWISPVVGVRLGFAGLGFTNYYLNQLDDTMQNENNYYTIHGDLMLNLTNWICGYKQDRVYNGIFFVGVGYGNSHLADANGSNQEWLVPVGYLSTFRLCDAWAINLELRDLLVRNAFANYQGAKTEYGVANILSLTAGVTYKFKNRGFNVYEPIDKALYDNRISSLERDLNNANSENDNLKKQIEKYKKSLDEETRAKNEALENAKKNSGMNVDEASLGIFFTIGSAEISDKFQSDIDFMANLIKASNGKTFTVTGYADRETGTETRNQKLSQERAEAVRDALVAKGVNANQIKVDYKGCSVQPFEGKGYLNRVAIIEVR